MEANNNFSGIWKSNEHTVDVDLSLIIFADDGTDVVYCPALDISGYGLNEQEAIESFKIALGEFFQYTLHEKTFISELKRLGWTVTKNKNSPMIPPTMSKMLEENKNFSNIFNNYPFRKIDEQFSLSA
jgi:hypothetical protein